MVIPLLPYSIRCLLSSITLFVNFTNSSCVCSPRPIPLTANHTATSLYYSLHCNVYAAYHSYKSISRGDNLSMLRWMSYWSVLIALIFNSFHPIITYTHKSTLFDHTQEYDWCFSTTGDCVWVFDPQHCATVSRDQIRHFALSSYFSQCRT